jgi:RNA polymerase sigma-70 factor (ECF subfamily)
MNRHSTTNFRDNNDEELIARARAGEDRAFDELYRRVRPAALALAAQVCGRALAEDAVQSAFLSAWTALGRFQPARGSARSWLLSIVRNRAIDVLREQRRRGPSAELEFEPEDPERTEALVARNEMSREVRRALGKLPPDQREVLELAYYSELSQAEIASTLRVPLGTVKGRARLGLRKLPGELAAYSGPEALTAA